MNVLCFKKNCIYLLLCFCIIINIDFSFAQSSEFSFPPFNIITTEQGLSNRDVQSIMQDNKGFMWIATHNGLNRYDGYEFKTYKYNISDSNSLQTGWYNKIIQDAKGIIWLPSGTNGLFSFDPLTEKFMHYVHDAKNKNSLVDDIINCVAIDTNGNLWLGTQSGLDYFNPETKIFTHCIPDQKDKSKYALLSLCLDDNQNLWLVSDPSRVDFYNTKAKQLTKNAALGSASQLINIPKPYSIDKGKNGNIWIGSEQDGLYGYNIHTKKLIQFFHRDNDPYSLSNNGVFSTYEDHNGNLWIITNTYEIAYYNRATGKFYCSKATYAPLAIFEDTNNKIWVATGNGIVHFDTKFKKFVCFSHDPANKNSITDNYVVCFQRDHKNRMMVSSTGVDYFDEATQSFVPLKIMEGSKNIMEGLIVWQTYIDSKGLLWMATDNGLISYNERTNTHHWYRYDEKDSTSLSQNSCTGIIEDDKGRYWVTTWTGGFAAFDPATGKFRRFKVHDGPNSISTNSVGYIFKDSHGMLYIGSWAGLITFNPDKETFKIFRHNAKDNSTISCDIQMNWKETKEGIIYIGTMGGGLNAFNPSTGKFRAFTEKDGLCNDDVRCFAEDNDGRFWIGTTNGLSCFTPPKDPFDSKSKFSFRNYDMSDGLPSNEMCLSTAYKDADGKLFFGTQTKGMFYFYPDDLIDNKDVPPVYITNLKLDNKQVLINDSTYLLKSTIESTTEIVLSYSQNIFSLEFAALNYFHSEKNKYAYLLEGFDKNWNYSNASNRIAHYTNLDPGEYIFKVKGSNNDGIWNETPTELKIIITPPFWQTVWFKLLVIMAIAGSVYAFYRYRIGQILLLQRIRNKIASDLHDDIGSTLNSISVFSEVAKKDSSRRDHALNMIGESSRKVIESMSDIVWSINPENDNFDKIIFRMRSLTHNILKAKKIDCTFRADESLNELKLPMHIRRNFYLIFKEALNNLVKYSNATRASVLVSHQNKSVTFIIRDDGVGFDSSTEFGGNGLSNMKKRAAEIGALLLIDSGLGNGTSIELNLKL